MAELNFDARKATALLPDGWYYAYLSASESKRTAKGFYVRCVFQVMDSDEGRGRLLSTFFHLESRSVKYMRQAQKRLDKLYLALNEVFNSVESIDHLRGRPVRVHVVSKPANGDFPAHNDIDDFSAVRDLSAKPPPPVTPAPAAAPQINSAEDLGQLKTFTYPWESKP